MDYASTTEQLKQAALTENPTLFKSTWDFVVADHESIPALESPIENLEKAVFAKDLPLVRSILEEEKDNIVIQKMGLQFSVPLSYYHAFDSKTYLRDVKIPLYSEKDTLATALATALKKYGGGIIIPDNYVKAQSYWNEQRGKWDVEYTDSIYIPNLLRHACFFGNVGMLRTLLSFCKKLDDLRTYATPPFAGLALCAEYDNPECFKILYETLGLKKWHIGNKLLWRERYNFLEYFVLDVHNKKIVETLLKTGCFDINDCLHVRYKDYGKVGVQKDFEGKTLLDIVLERKDQCRKKNTTYEEIVELFKKYGGKTIKEVVAIHPFNNYFPEDIQKAILLDKNAAYYEKIAELLRKYGGKTAMEVAAIHPFNDYFPADLQKNILYQVGLLDQQKCRLVCPQWKKIVDDNPLAKNLQSYFKLLRNPKSNHDSRHNTIRVLMGATYNKKHDLVETFLKYSKTQPVANEHYLMFFNKKNLKHYTLNNLKHNTFRYHFSLFIPDETTEKLVQKYRSSVSRNILYQQSELNELIVASFLDNTVKLQEIAIFLQKELAKPHSSFDVRDIRNALRSSCIILADYDCDKSMSTMVKVLKEIDFFNSFFNDLVVISHQLKSLKVLKVLLSSGIDINQTNEEKYTIKDIIEVLLSINQANEQKYTIKDSILEQSKQETDTKYTAAVNSLLDKYGARTYEEVLKYNNLKKMIVGGACIGAVATIWYYLFHSKST